LTYKVSIFILFETEYLIYSMIVAFKFIVI